MKRGEVSAFQNGVAHYLERHPLHDISIYFSPISMVPSRQTPVSGLKKLEKERLLPNVGVRYGHPPSSVVEEADNPGRNSANRIVCLPVPSSADAVDARSAFRPGAAPPCWMKMALADVERNGAGASRQALRQRGLFPVVELEFLSSIGNDGRRCNRRVTRHRRNALKIRCTPSIT